MSLRSRKLLTFLPGWSNCTLPLKPQTVKDLPAMQESLVRSLGKVPWRREWQPTPVFLPGESHGQRSPAGYSPGGRKGTDMSEELTLFHFLIRRHPLWSTFLIWKGSTLKSPVHKPQHVKFIVKAILIFYPGLFPLPCLPFHLSFNSFMWTAQDESPGLRWLWKANL